MYYQLFSNIHLDLWTQGNPALLAKTDPEEGLGLRFGRIWRTGPWLFLSFSWLLTVVLSIWVNIYCLYSFGLKLMFCIPGLNESPDAFLLLTLIYCLDGLLPIPFLMEFLISYLKGLVN